MAIIINVISIIFVWLVSLFNGTGLGTTYHTTEYADYMIILLAVFLFICRANYKIQKSDFFISLGLGVFFVAIPWIKSYGFGNWQYVCSFILIYILSQVNVKKLGLYYGGMAAGGLGIIILYIYNYGTALSGWNDNSIAMIGLFSYLIFLIGFFNTEKKWTLFILLIVTVYFYQMQEPTDSRSCQLIVILSVVAMFLVRNKYAIFQNKKFIIICLLLPLIIALIVCLVSQSSIMSQINLWSIKEFQKPAFNGRDEIWLNGFQSMGEHFLFGTGQYTFSSQHNSAVTCLVNFGVIGYIFWIYTFYEILKKGEDYISDYIVKSCILAFLLMYVQQSVELGIISQNPNLLIYLPLGLMLGRVKYLKECERSGRNIH